MNACFLMQPIYTQQLSFFAFNNHSFSDAYLFPRITLKLEFVAQPYSFKPREASMLTLLVNPTSYTIKCYSSKTGKKLEELEERATL